MKDVRIRNKAEGTYTRLANLEDIYFLLECTSDWPNGAWTYNMVEQTIKSSIGMNYNNNFDGEEFRKACIIFCLSDGTRLGFSVSSFYTLDNPNVSTHSTKTDVQAIHPDHRGQGYFSKFNDHLLWYLSNYTDAQTNHAEILQHEKSFPAEARALRKAGAVDNGIKSAGFEGNLPKKKITRTREGIVSEVDNSAYERIEIT